ncbi:MAG TPA: chemotaxis protein CheW [Usitatibacter sp.]|nr:chemotaxis protein CheW [Usitatibacter sp.]
MQAAEIREKRDEFLSFRLGEEEYAIDILQVREIRPHETPTRIAGAPDFVKGVINLRGTIVPIVDLRARFGLPPRAASSDPVVIILAIAERPLGIVVDGVSDVVALAAGEIRPAPVEFATLVERGFVRGLAPIDERLLIVVDLVALLGDPAPAERQAA